MKNTFFNEFQTKQALSEFIVKTRMLSMNVQCMEFERAFSQVQGREYSILYNSGASANLALIQSLKNLGRLKEGDKIGFSSLTWSTNVMPIIQMGMLPVPIDCEPITLNVMSYNLTNILKREKLKALFITNALGFAGDLFNIKDICDEEKIILIEDNCEALGTELNSGRAGNFGIASSFSFFVAHHMSTIEGGMLCCDDEELMEMFKIVRANGWDRNLETRQQLKWRKRYKIISEFDAKYTFYDLGYNMRPTEITGFLGLYQLQFLKENIIARESNYMQLEKIVNQNNDLVQFDHRHIKLLSSFAFPILCKTSDLRKKYLSQFSGAGIEIRPMIAGNIQNQPFYKKYVNNKAKLPGVDFIHNNSFYCGNYPELTDSELIAIGSCLSQY